MGVSQLSTMLAELNHPAFAGLAFMLVKKTYRDLNPDKEYQKLLCYHYTISLKERIEGVLTFFLR